MPAQIRLVFDPGEPKRFFTDQDNEFGVGFEKMVARVGRSAKRRAPRRQGELRKAIRWYTDVDAEGLYGDVGSNLLHGKFQETGHKAPDGTRVKARRYLRPALRGLKGRGRRR